MTSITSGYLFIASILLAAAGDPGPSDWIFHREGVLGTSFRLVVAAETEADAVAAERASLDEIARLSRILSTYDPASEWSRWDTSLGIEVDLSAELFHVLESSDRWREKTQGAFDPRVALFSQLWERAALRGTPPSSSELAEALKLARLSPWRLLPNSTKAIRLSNQPVTLDAIAKGTILDHAAQAAQQASPGVRAALLEIGGDLALKGNLPRQIAIADPAADQENGRPWCVVQLASGGLATSGSSQRGFLVGGSWYSHIIDPRSGQPVSNVVSATVYAPCAEDADALATAFTVLPTTESLQIAQSLPGVECLLIDSQGNASHTPGWAALQEASSRSVNSKEAGDQQESTFELLVRFKINRPDPGDRGYRRPYVAIWIEDPEGRPVRTLLLFISMGGPGPRWVTDLKRWYKSDRERRRTDKQDILYTISRPTRPPGNYEVLWDGKDDHGHPVPQGDYTILLEAAREHGTYQLIREKIQLGPEPFTRLIPGNIEIESASLDYRPRNPPN